MDSKSVCFSSGPIFLYFCLLWLHCPTILKRLEGLDYLKVSDLRIGGIELKVLVVINVDLVGRLLALTHLVDERPPDDKVPDDALVNLLKLLQDGVPVVLHLLGLVLVELNEGVGLAADDLQTGIENTGF